MDGNTQKVGVLISTVADDGGIKTTQAELTVLGDTAKKSAATASSAFDDFNKSLNNIGTKATNVGRDLSMYISLPIAAVGIGSLKMAGDFEQSLNVLQSVTGATAGQMTKLGQEAKDLGNDVSLPGLSAKDAAAGMTELAKAGLSVNDVMTASKGVLSLAKAGQLDVADAAMTTARALNAFQLSGDQAGRIADLLSAAANASTASVSDMALGLQMGGAQSHQMGVSLQDTVTALSLFSNAGINGSDAGTSLKQMFLQLATPTTAASALMKQLNLDFFDAKGNFIGLSSTAEMLRTKLEPLTQEQRNYTLATIFGSDATRVASILAQGGSAAFDKMSVSVNKSGAATALAAAQNKGFNGALDNLKSTAETTMIQLGTILLPAVTRELKKGSDEVGKLSAWFAGLSHNQQKAIIEAAGTAAIMGPSILVLGKVATSVSSIITLTKTLADTTVAKSAVQVVAWTANAAAVGLYTKSIELAELTGMTFWASTTAILAGIAADAYLVVKAIQAITGAMNAVNDANNAKASAADQSGAIKDIEAKYKAGKINKTQETNSINALLKGVDSVYAHASGTSYAPGGRTVVGEQGPEVVDMPRGARVYPARQSGSMMGGGDSHYHFEGASFSFGDAKGVKQFFNQLNSDTLLASKGFSIRQGS